MSFVVWILWRLATRYDKSGWWTFGWFLVLSGIERLLVEFVRRNPIWFWHLTQPQWVSIVSIVDRRRAHRRVRQEAGGGGRATRRSRAAPEARRAARATVAARTDRASLQASRRDVAGHEEERAGRRVQELLDHGAVAALEAPAPRQHDELRAVLAGLLGDDAGGLADAHSDAVAAALGAGREAHRELVLPGAPLVVLLVRHARRRQAAGLRRRVAGHDVQHDDLAAARAERVVRGAHGGRGGRAALERHVEALEAGDADACPAGPAAPGRRGRSSSASATWPIPEAGPEPHAQLRPNAKASTAGAADQPGERLDGVAVDGR